MKYVNETKTTETGGSYMYHLTDNKRTHQSAELFFKALYELLCEKDLTEITVSELVERAGLGRATFYRLFDSMKDVLQYKCDLKFVELQQSIEVYREKQGMTEPLPSTSLLVPLLRFWYTDSLVIDAIIKAKRIDILHAKIENMFSMLYERIDLGDDNKEDKEIFVTIRTGILFNLLLTWVKNKKETPPDQLASVVLNQIKEVDL
jgi:AcrR family transcriptional regulator